MARFMAQGANSMSGLTAPLIMPAVYALLYWSRCSELSADRVGAMIAGKEAMAKLMARLLTPTFCNEINMEAVIAQAEELDHLSHHSGTFNKIMQFLGTAELDHPYLAQRLGEVMRWGNTPEYTTLRNFIAEGHPASEFTAYAHITTAPAPCTPPSYPQGNQQSSAPQQSTLDSTVQDATAKAKNLWGKFKGGF